MDWRSDAACREVDPETFFPTGQNEPLTREIRRAKAICHECPVINDCLRWALAQPAMEGIWGGTTSAERASIRRRRATRGMRVVV